MKFKTLVIFLITTLVLFYPTFTQGKVPFPGNYMLAWYQPWKADNLKGSSIAISHKPVVSDTFRQFYPYKMFIGKSLRRLQFPLWNPYNGSGMPLFATMHIGILNPTNLFFVFLDGKSAWTAYIILQFVITLLFTYLFAKKINISSTGAIISSLSFALSGSIVVGLMVTEFVYALGLLPLILFSVESYLLDKKSRCVYLVSPLILLLLVSGHPQIIFYVLSFTLFYILFRSRQLNISYASVEFFNLVLFILLGILMSAIQIIPTLELAKNASLNTTSSKFIFNKFLVPIQDLITIIIPNYFGSQSTYNYWGSSDYVETINYMGSVPFVLAFIASIKVAKKANIARIFLFSAIATTLLALNWLLPKLIFSLPVPIVSTGAPSRIFVLTTFSIAILAGFGFDYLQTKIKSFKNFLSLILPVPVILILILGATFLAMKTNMPCNNNNVTNCRLIATRNTLLELSVFISFLIIMAIYLKSKSEKILNYGVILIIMAIGLYNGIKFLPFTTRSQMMPSNSLINEISGNKMNRVFGMDEANIKTDFATYYHFYDPDYYDPLYIKRYGELVGFGNGVNLSNLSRSDVEITNDSSLSMDKNFNRERLFDLIGVNQIIYKNYSTNVDRIIWKDSKWTLISRNSLASRVFTVNNVRTIKDDKEILKILFDKNFNPFSSAIIEKPLNNKIEASQGSITNFVDNLNSLGFDVNSSSDTFLVLTDNYFPGWKAFVDNHSTELYRTNYTFRGIFIPKGNHHVSFTYFPDSLKIGIIMTVAGITLYLLIYLRFIWPKIRSNKN